MFPLERVKGTYFAFFAFQVRLAQSVGLARLVVPHAGEPMLVC
jgi:hypothetical protein